MAKRRLLNRLAEHIAKKERRENRTISNRSIAEHTGLSRSTVDGYVRNDRQQYDVNNIMLLCDHLGIDPVTDFWVVELVESPNDESGHNRNSLAVA